MKNKWKTTELGDICKFNYGKGLPKRKRIHGIYPVYGSGGIVDYNKEYYIKGPGIIVGRKGTIGSVYFEKKNFFPIDTVFYITENKEVYDIRFLYYLLLDLGLYRLNSDAAVPGLNRNVAYQQKISLPSLNIQNKISSILSAYDDLIENNTRRIKILEEMAQLIYREWFVHFRFPGHEKVKMVDSELGKIPEGWEVRKLEDFVDFIKGFEPGTKNYLDKKMPNTIPFLRVGDLNDRRSQIWIYKNIAKDRILNKKDIALTLDGTPGIVKIGNHGAYSSGIQKVVIKDKKITWAYLYFLLKSEQIQETIKAYSSGTTIIHAGFSRKYMKFLIPRKEIVYDFEKCVSTLLQLKLILEEKNDFLRINRDYLLPKLISGTIDVSDLDIKTEEIK
ncbi:MAG TPA: hypothetical protein DEG96_05950 [Candidatus Atribacteria bacterium]|uniref:Restriction modification system DNA specificity domain protein n=1 Tax=candidate division TA06 bacterium 34_109 TaxID=1635277 RepID=A0A117M655_UNCT6|nr:MAG: Restriction modification system DNA specificity domain protein [candidate division TA06 bacterium 34_109]HBY57388.1 hypothetical protein [Candidatus Atribacteria bacterium]